MATAIAAVEATEISSEVLSSQTNELLNNGDIKASSVDRYRFEWAQILNSLENNLKHLRNRAYLGELKTSKFRSICWALLLRVLNDEPSDWILQRKQQRSRFEKLKAEFARNPHKKHQTDDDPLSQSKQSAWNQYFGDQELFAVIKQDVIRTFPGVDFFRKPFIQEAMINILFYYAREHPYMCYRQGMHEILAPILFVMYSDHQSLLHFQEIANSIDNLLLNVLDPAYLEADSYSLFSRLMSSIESYYRVANLVPTEGGFFPSQTKIIDTTEENVKIDSSNNEVEVIGQLNFIRDKILAKEDLHLHNQLLKLDIPLPIFGIRWLRLLFGREFPLLDLLVLWDAIFADSDRFELPNYILVAMLIRIRDRLLLNDYITCLTYLMKYPKNVDISLILRHALHMYLPKIFERPLDAFVYVTMQPHTSSLSVKPILPQLPAIKPQIKDELTTTINRSRAGSLDSNGISKKNRQTDELTTLQYKNAANMARLSHLKIATESDRLIVDGLTTTSPEYLQLQIQNQQTVIAVTKMKLKKYLLTFRKHINQNDSEDLVEAVDGLDNLCDFLEVKLAAPMNSFLTPVDQALEASEIALKKNTTKNRTEIIPKRFTEIEAKHGFVQNLKNDIPTSTTMGTNNSAHSSIDRSISVEQSPVKAIVPGTRYEIPDNGYMNYSSRILGNRRDVELRTFKDDQRTNIPSISNEGIPRADPLGSRDD